MKALLSKYGARIIAGTVLVSLGVLFGCGGSAGVQEGTVVGRVFSDASSISGSRSPISGVTVVIRREGFTPAVIRRTLTDANGNFVFSDVPTGGFTIGYAKEGFLPIDGGNGASTTLTNAFGRDLFVEPGQTVVVPDVTMETNRQTGSGTVIITVLDGVTGDPVTHATVTAGMVATANGGNNGVYTLNVPILPSDTSSKEGPLDDSAKRVSIQADGYQPENAVTIGPIANETIRRTVYLNPLTVTIDGVVKISKWQALFNLGQVEIRVTNTLGPASVGPAPNGLFTIAGIPASNSNLTRTFNLRFTHPDLQTVMLTNIVAPRAGDRTIPMTVVMTPLVVDVSGTVVDSGSLPASGTAVLVQTGQIASVVNGSYTFSGVPVRQATGDIPYTIEIRVFNALGGAETGSITGILPQSDGSTNPIFFVPLIRTSGATNPSPSPMMAPVH